MFMKKKKRGGGWKRGKEGEGKRLFLKGNAGGLKVFYSLEVCLYVFMVLISAL